MEDQSQAERPALSCRDHLVQFVLDLHRVNVRGQSQPQRQPTDMGVHRQPGQAKRHASHHVGRLPADPGQRHQILAATRNLAVEAGDNLVGHTDEALRLSSEESGGMNDLLDVALIRCSHGGRVGVPSKEHGCDQVHSDIGALGRKDGGSQQFKWIAVRQRTEIRGRSGEFSCQPTVRLTCPSALRARFYHRADTTASLTCVDSLTLTIFRQMDPAMAEQVEELRAMAERSDGYDPLSEHKRILLGRSVASWPPDGVGTRGVGSDPAADLPSDGFVAILARVATYDGPVGYAQLNRSGVDGSMAIEIAVSPDHRDAELTVAGTLLGAALQIVAESVDSGHIVRYWTHHATPDDDRLAREHGLHVERELIQMRRPLPVEGERAPITVRGFIPGLDEVPWLEVNNRAFSAHPEQGGWDLETLLQREHEPWFDAEAFRIHEEDDRLVASCWTKVHTDTTPPLGEIYVISVDPDFQGRGLGKAMTLAGLDWLARVGIRTGMLYVDGDNHSAVSLYRSMGFTDHHVDRAYAGTVGSSANSDEAAGFRLPGAALR